MLQGPLDPRLAGRLKTFTQGLGSSTAKATIKDWISRAEQGDPKAGRVDDLTDVIRAITIISLARSRFGLVETSEGIELDLQVPGQGGIPEAFQLPFDLLGAVALRHEHELVLSGVQDELLRSILDRLTAALVEALELS
jgi:hypothetical protein